MSDATRDRRRAPELMLRLEGYLPASGVHLALTTSVHPATRAGMRELHEELADAFRTALVCHTEDPFLVALAADGTQVLGVRLVAMPGRTGYVTHGADEPSQAVEAWLSLVVTRMR